MNRYRVDVFSGGRKVSTFSVRAEDRRGAFVAARRRVGRIPNLRVFDWEGEEPPVDPRTYVVTGYGAGRVHISRADAPSALDTLCGLELRDGIPVVGAEIAERFPMTKRCERCSLRYRKGER